MTLECVRDLSDLAEVLAGFLLALQLIDTAGGPPLGEHTFGRGGPISLSEEEVMKRSRHWEAS